MQCGSELEDGFVEAGLAQTETNRAFAHPAKIEEKRFLRERAKKAGRKSVGVLGRERGSGTIPLQSAAGNNNQDVRRAVSANPVISFFRHPRRGGRFRRCEQNEEKRLIESIDGTGPEGRIYRAIGLISKNVHCA